MLKVLQVKDFHSVLLKITYISVKNQVVSANCQSKLFHLKVPSRVPSKKLISATIFMFIITPASTVRTVALGLLSSVQKDDLV